MLEFDQTPPSDSNKYTMPLMRTPTGQKIKLVLTCGNLMGCKTHFVGNRTQPHDSEYCEYCDRGFAWRWHGYVTGLLQGTLDHVMFEFTAQAADNLTRYKEDHGTLRSCLMTAFRINKRSNARVILHCQQSDMPSLKLPKEPDIPKCLCHIWGMSFEEQASVGHGSRGPQIHLDKEGTSKNGRSAKPPVEAHGVERPR